MMRKKLPADRAMEAQKMMEKPQWRASALAIATAVLLGGAASEANALALGRITVQSALGEPLRAEVDIPEINAEEVSTLRATIASPQAFRSAGLEYNQALTATSVTLQRRADGRYFLNLSSDRPINDPFVDLILETNWSSGRIVRDYTMLFDPPNLRQSTPQVAAQTPAAPSAAAAPGRTIAATPLAPAPGPAAASRGTGTRAAPAPRQPVAPKPPSGDGKQVTVQNGDTAGKIAAANKPPSISLDQMLVALLRSNPEAFSGGNVNRLRSGAVLDIPSSEQASAIAATEASQTVVAQSRDFNEFRRRLAEGLPTANVATADRQASGRLQAKVEETRPGAAAPDKLTLSKGAVQGKATDDTIARQRAAQEAAARVAELNKNISDLSKLGTASAPAGSGAAASAPKSGVPVAAMAGASAAKPASAPPMPVVPASAAKPTATPASSPPAPVAAPAAMPVAAPASAAAAPAAVAASAPASAPAPVASAPAPAASATAVAAASAPMAPASAAAPQPPKPAAASPAAKKPAEPSLIDDMMENPIIPLAGGGLLALLVGFGVYRARQRKKSTQVDSSFLESRLQPDSFFGASGGQRIDTAEGNATGSSMVYSPSQLDAAGDVDPVAEADVYLAYGRDLQAEEILKEAMRTTPQRVAIHSKLLEIYAKRRDTKAFEQVATEAHNLTRGEGPEWEHICEVGQELDAGNALYRPGGGPGGGGAAPVRAPAAAPVAVAAVAAVAAAAAAAPSAGNYGATTAMSALPAQDAGAADLDLDLDFSIGDDAPPAAASAAAAAATTTLALNLPTQNQPAPALDMDFGAPDAGLGAKDSGASHVDLPLLEPTAAAAPAPARAAPAAPAAPVADPGMIEFDLGELSLDLGAPAAAQAAAHPPDEAGSTAGFDDTGGDPLATKLALAQEFNAIGDPDGARSLAEEVLASATGDLKSRAQRFLAEIG